VLFEYRDLRPFSAYQGAWIIRLDAVARLSKEIGTPSSI